MDALKEGQALYRDAMEALSDERTRITEDLKFTDPAEPDQWDEAERIQRENDPGGRRPCLTYDQLGQYIEVVAGQVESAPPSIAATPVDSQGDKRLAEQFSGIFRNIEAQSRASHHYAVAQRSAARAGVGYLVMRPTVVDRALNYQEPRIASVGDPLSAVRDPWAVELDGSDATFGYVLTSLSCREFKRQHPKADPVSFGDERLARDDESVIVAEEWRITDESVNIIIAADDDGVEFTLTEDEYWQRHQTSPVRYLRNYMDKRRKVTWRTMSGAEVFEETTYPADSVGLVPVFGYVGFENGRLKCAGIGRKARDQQRAYNFHKSEERALMAQLARAPWLMPLSALRDESIKTLWDRASVEARAYLPYDDWDAENNRTIAPPTKLQPAIDLRNHIMAAQEARDNIRAVLGMYAPSLGEPSNATSGVAIRAQQGQGDAATALFPAHLKASVAQVARLCISAIPKMVDTRRQLRMAGLDGSSSGVMADPKQDQAVVETAQGLVINPNVGRYDIRATVGQNFGTQREQAKEVLGEIMARNPALAQIVAPIWAMNLDFMGADKLAEVLIAALPPEARAIFKPEQEGKPTSEALMQQNAQLKQALQEAIQHAREAQAEAEEAGKRAEEREEADRVAWFKAETERLKVTGANEAQIQAIVQRMVSEMLTMPGPEGLEAHDEAPMNEAEPMQHDMQPFPMAEPIEPPEMMGMPDADA